MPDRPSVAAPRIERLPITHPDAQLLVEAVQEEYVARYGGRDESPVDPRDFEDPLGQFFVGEFTNDQTKILAGSVISALPTVLAYVFLQRFFVDSIVATGIKG